MLKAEEEYLVLLEASLQVVKYLIRGGLTFTGYNEEENSVYKGDFLELLEVLGSENEKIAAAIKSGGGNCKLSYHVIQRDLANACAVETVKKIVKEIGDDIFCVLVEGLTDCSGKEQMTVVVRFVDDRGFVVERLIGIVHVEDTSAVALKESLEAFLSGVGLRMSKIRGQGYDGARNMLGQFEGLKALIQKENPQTYYVNNFAHQLQSTLVLVARNHKDVNWFFFEVSRIVNLLRSSNKEQDLLQHKQVAHFANLLERDFVDTDRGLNHQLSIYRTGDTRWGSHFQTLSGLIDLLTPIIEVFEDMENDDSYLRGEQTSLLNVMQTFQFVFILHLMVDVLRVTNDLSQALQKRDQNIVNAMELVQTSKKRLQEMREDGWEEFFKQVVSSCGYLEIDVLDMDARYVEVYKPKRLAPSMTNLHYFKNDCFFRVIDLVLQELNDRFTPDNIELLHCVASLSPCSSFGAFDAKSLIRLARLYPNDFEDVCDRELSNELHNYIENVKMDINFSNLKGISDLSTTLVRTKKHETYRFVYKLVKLALSLPVATPSVERVFSGMNFVKKEFENKMSNTCLNDCLVTFIEKEVFSTIDDIDIIKRFQDKNRKKM